MDSSIFITLNRVYNFGLLPDSIWTLLDGLFDSGRLMSHEFVFSELCPETNKPDFLAQWIKSKKRFFHAVTLKQTQLVQQILAEFPELISPNKEINEADPWLIALALEKRQAGNLIENYSALTVVSNESIRSATKIPAVCARFGVPHLGLKAFFDDNGWKVTLET